MAAEVTILLLCPVAVNGELWQYFGAEAWTTALPEEFEVVLYLVSFCGKETVTCMTGTEDSEDGGSYREPDLS